MRLVSQLVGVRPTASLLALLAATACAVAPELDSTPNYRRDIAPILATNCTSCHSEGGIAPFPLTTYAEVKDFASLIQRATHDRTMPPVTIDNSGDCNHFQDTPWLTDDELAAITGWEAAGAPEGEEGVEPAVVTQAVETTIRVSTTVDMGALYQPSDAGTDDYRCFVIDAGLDHDQFLTGFHVLPGDARIVHHVLLYAGTDGTDDEAALALDAQDELPGYECFGGPGVGQPRLYLAWAPGSEATRFPFATGLPIEAGRKLIMQVHYNTLAGPFPDRTRIELELADRVVTPARMELLDDGRLDVAGGGNDETYSWEFPLGDIPQLTILGAFPHMHTLGVSQRFEVIGADGTPRCVQDTPRWDFHWQRLFFLDRGFPVVAGEGLRLTCHYDTRGREDRVRWGEGTADEMCLVGVYFAIGDVAQAH